MEKITINVLKTDIVRGKREEPGSCAIARAAKRKGLQNVEVDGRITFEKGGKSFKGVLPTKIQNWIGKFDNPRVAKDSLKPFSFDVEVEETRSR
jgi:hypothetical protein